MWLKKPLKPRVPVALGNAGGLLALALIGFSTVGALWGFFRPGYVASMNDDGKMFVKDAFNVEITGYLTFVGLTGVLGLILGVVASMRSLGKKSLGMVVWLIMIGILGCLSFLLVGDVVAGVVHSTSSILNSKASQEFVVVPILEPGVALVAAPLMASLTYWVNAMLTWPSV